jgi:hypothetical protein
VVVNVDFHHGGYFDEKNIYMLEEINWKGNGATS